jgi:hypothetical protein
VCSVGSRSRRSSSTSTSAASRLRMARSGGLAR